MIPVNKIKVPFNYVMVKPGESFKTYQMNGQETGITVSPLAENDGQHLNVKAQVFAIPTTLIFNGEEINDIQRNFPNDPGQMKRAGDLRDQSMMYDVDMEVEVGDWVVFGYQQYYDCMKNGRMVDTEQGEMLFIRYDELVCTFREGNERNFWMLNGYVLVEPLEIPHVVEDGVMYYLNDKTNFKLPLMRDDIYLRKRRYQYGRIDRVGSICRGYRDFPGLGDDRRELHKNDIVIYNPAYAINLEYDLHRTLSEKKLYRFNRKDILMVIEDSMNFDINSVISDFINN